MMTANTGEWHDATESTPIPKSTRTQRLIAQGMSMEPLPQQLALRSRR